MQLSEFLTKNKIEISPEVLESSAAAVGEMSRSHDVLHDVNHILRLLDILDQFINWEKDIRPRINFDILILALLWHDIWKAKIKVKSTFGLIWAFLWDGHGSARIFTTENKSKIPPDIFKSALYAIKVHGPSIGNPKTLEAKILKDIDGLDEWSAERLDALVKHFLGSKQESRRMIRLLKLYYNLVLKKQKANKYYFLWPQEEFTRRRDVYLAKIDILLKKYENLV